MHFAQLQSQMTRYHENIRPRYQNPTYVSSNVGSSLGTSIYRSQSTRDFGTKSLLLPHINQQTTKKQIGLNTEKFQDSSRRSEASSRNRKSTSNLSNYGTTSLGPMKKYISDKEVYEKQQKKYNIVTIQPKQYVDTINIFPKYRLQNSDANYYKKLVIQNQISSKKNPIFELKPKKMDQDIDRRLDLNPENAVKSNLPTKPFRGKLLNNIDEIAGIL